MDNPNEGVGSLLPAVSRGRLRLLRRLNCGDGHLPFARTQYDSQPRPQTGSAKRAQRCVPCQGLRRARGPARSAAVGVPTVRPAAGTTPRSGLVQPTLQRPCHRGAPLRQAVPLCEEAQPRTKTLRTLR
ncbi:protein of unknown function [Cupriavidus taiwanensis]|nr:protein of unknown function [Cupriavidus taiwanensis]